MMVKIIVTDNNNENKVKKEFKLRASHDKHDLAKVLAAILCVVGKRLGFAAEFYVQENHLHYDRYVFVLPTLELITEREENNSFVNQLNIWFRSLQQVSIKIDTSIKIKKKQGDVIISLENFFHECELLNPIQIMDAIARYYSHPYNRQQQ